MKRWIIGISIVVFVWYGVVLFLIPRITCCGGPVMPELARGSLQTHGSEVCNQHARLGDRRSSFALQQMEILRGHGNWYLVATLFSQGSVSAAVVVYPQYSHIYRHNFVYRLAFWNWDVYKYPTFILTREGDFYRNNITWYDSTNPPTEEVLHELGQARAWTFERRLPLTPPCN